MSEKQTRVDLGSELGSPVSIPSPEDGVITAAEIRELTAADEKHQSRVLKYRLKQANKTMGKQGQTIANLRGELARVREEHSKIDRGELRRLERVEADAVGHFRQAAEMATRATEEIKRLNEENALIREELAKARGHVVTGQHAVDRAAAELEDHA